MKVESKTSTRKENERGKGQERAGEGRRGQKKAKKAGSGRAAAERGFLALVDVKAQAWKFGAHGFGIRP